MNFFIKHKATSPELVLELVENGTLNFQKYTNRIQNATARMTMTPQDGCGKKIICQNVAIEETNCGRNCSDCPSNYVLIYRWKPQDTNQKGIFVVTVEITFLDDNSKLIVPIHEELLVHII